MTEQKTNYWGVVVDDLVDNSTLDVPPLDFSALAHQEGGNNTMEIRTLAFIHANGLPFIEGSIVACVARWIIENDIADLKGARAFLNALIELEEKRCNPAVNP